MRLELERGWFTKEEKERGGKGREMGDLAMRSSEAELTRPRCEEVEEELGAALLLRRGRSTTKGLLGLMAWWFGNGYPMMRWSRGAG